jgi:hypothetical protein
MREGRPRLPESKLKGEIAVTSRTDADDKWMVAVDPVDRAVHHLPLRPQGQEADQALRQPARSWRARRSPMHPVEIKSRDG